MKKLIIALAVTTAVAAPAAAQQQNGLVNVNVANVLNNLDLDLLNNSLNGNTVQVPVSIAANVCGITANVLAVQRKRGGKVNCTATSTSPALKNAVQKQLLKPKA